MIEENSVSMSAGTALFEGELVPKQKLETAEPVIEKKKKKKKIIKKVKKVKKPKSIEINVNASNNSINAEYSLKAFVARTGGTGALPHFSYFEKESDSNWAVFDDGNCAVATAAEIAPARDRAVLLLFNKK